MLIEYPANVADTEKALATLTLDLPSENAEIKLSKEGSSIHGDFKNFNGLIIRVPRGEWRDAKIVGSVSKVVQFRRMADFATRLPEEEQIEHSAMDIASSLDLKKIKNLSKYLHAPDGPRSERVLAYAPPCFTSSDFPFLKAINDGRGAVGIGELISASGAGRIKRNKHLAPWVANYSDQGPLLGPSQEIVLKRRRLYRRNFEKLKQLFTERPIWTKLALIARLSNEVGVYELGR